MKDKLQIQDFKNNFNSGIEISLNQIFEFYSKTEPGITKETVRKRAENLIKKGILKKTGKGVYSIGNQIDYKPVIELEIKKLYKKLHEKYPLVKFCLWNTRQLNEFMLHQPARFLTLVETEKDVSEYVFNFLKDFNKDVYQSTDKDIISKYASFTFNSIVVKDLTTESPIQIIEKTPTASLEKMLVDVFCDKDVFYTHQGSELEMIFTTAFEKYTINKSKLLRYAKRRGKSEIEEFIDELKLQTTV